MRILVVDDSSVMRKLVTRGLRQAGFNVDGVVEAGNGQEALGKLQEHSDIDMVLCDWNMPVMDGLAFVKSVRSSGQTIPIVMVTTEGGESKVNAAIEAGANGHIKKPFTPDMLKSTLSAYMT